MEKEPYIKIIVQERGFGVKDNVQLFINGEKVKNLINIEFEAAYDDLPVLKLVMR